MSGFLTIAAVYIGICGFMFVAQRRFLYAPDTTPPDAVASGVPDMERLALATEDGLEVLAWYRPPADDDMPVLAYFHGNAGHIGDRAFKMRPLMDAGIGALLLSYRGYGGNPGRPSEQGLYADGRAAVDFLRARGIGPDRLVLYGESMGSGVAVQIASETAPAALILEAPFTSLTTVAFQKVPYIPVPLLLRDRFDSISKIGGIHAPLLVIHGERDRTVTVGHGRRLLAAANEPKRGLFIAKAGHGDLYDFGVAGEVLGFLRATLSLPSGASGQPMPHPETNSPTISAQAAGSST